MSASTPWQAMVQPPRRFLLSRWPWLSMAYLLSGVGVGAVIGACFSLIVIGTTYLVRVIIVTRLSVQSVLALIGVIVLLCIFVLCGLGLARVERRRIRLIDPDPIDRPRRRTESGDLRVWAQARLRDPLTWQEIGYAVVCTILCLLDGVVLAVSIAPFAFAVLSAIDLFGGVEVLESLVAGLVGIVLVPFFAYLLTAWAGARAAITRAVLAPKETELGRRLTEVTTSRARLVDAFESERRRIERDLHDGTQQRLVALSVELGLARMDLPEGSEAATRLAKAQEQARHALVELRELVRGVYPQLLVERGLAVALADLASRSSLDVDTRLEVDARYPEPVEIAIFFAVAEALTNVAKHSGADRAMVLLERRGDRLIAEVTDEGVGGAELQAGTGMLGLADRLAVVDGRMYVSSPIGGPTVVRFEVPCQPLT
ncbi:sensor histidine kinase [Microlunatus speluncae]|uniref:sensor histidine kinase n=1 Tax=Microlunatus speluncae TaxID=2594267 RepID=UPI001266381B|nr:sensor histidine kinase [Microlunatus speluncae]